MKIEQAKELAENAIEQLAQAVEQGGSDALKRYLEAMSRFHEYSFGNVMLIAMQRPDATHVAGFQSWKKLGRYVKQGEKGIVIIAPMALRTKRGDECIPAESLDEKHAEETILRFRAVYVFDVSQTDGEPLPEFARVGGSPNGETELLKAFVTEQGITLEYSDGLGSAHGASLGGKILLRADLPPAEEFSVLVHELAHEMLHRDDRRKDTTKTIRETEAEAVAFVVSKAIGLDTNSAASDYIRLYNGDNETLAESLGQIQQTAAKILAALDPA